MHFVPIGEAFGAQIVDADLRGPLDVPTTEALRAALGTHHLLILRGQGLQPADQIRIMEAASGPVLDERADGSLHSFVSNAEPDALVRGDNRFPFHSDFGFTPEPLWALSLYGIHTVPGADTFFADTVAAAAALDEPTRAKVAGLTVTQMYSFDVSYDRDHRLRLVDIGEDADPSTYPRGSYPVLGRHPRLEVAYLRVSEQQSSHIDGLGESESEAVIAELFEHMYSDRFTYVHRWEPDDLVIWDNLAVQHGRAAFPVARHRLLRRVTCSPLTFAEIMAGIVVPDGFGAKAVIGGGTP